MTSTASGGARLLPPQQHSRKNISEEIFSNKISLIRTSIQNAPGRFCWEKNLIFDFLMMRPYVRNI